MIGLTGDKANGDIGGQSRTIYGPKHSFPHRMMHFGKRFQIQTAQPQAIAQFPFQQALASNLYELYSNSPSTYTPSQEISLASLPYLLSAIRDNSNRGQQQHQSSVPEGKQQNTPFSTRLLNYFHQSLVLVNICLA